MTHTDLDDGREYRDWRELIDAGLTGCTCEYVVIEMRRDTTTGHVIGALYNHTDDTCAAVLGIVTTTVDQITDDPDKL